MLLLVFVVSSGSCYMPVATLDVAGYNKIPLRVATIMPNTEEDWLGRRYSQGWKKGSLKTPLQCYDPQSKTFTRYSDGREEPIYEQPYEVSLSYLRRQADETFRRNVPLFFEHVTFFTEAPTNATSYHLLVYPKLLQWPRPGDPTDRVEVSYEFRFQTPSGQLLMKTVATGNADTIAYTSLLHCKSLDYGALQAGYIKGLGVAQANMISALFSQPEVIDFLREYTNQPR